jgi:hypothetical protein
MLRIERGPGTLTIVSRFSRPRALAVLAGALVALALLAVRPLPATAAALAGLAFLVVVVGGRAVRAAFVRGRVHVSAPVPFGRVAERPLAGYSAVKVETLAEERRRKAERQARAYRARAGSDLPSWLRPADQPGANDHLRRLVLEGPGAEPLAVTAWLAEDDLEAARVEVEAVLAGR